MSLPVYRTFIKVALHQTNSIFCQLSQNITRIFPLFPCLVPVVLYIILYIVVYMKFFWTNQSFKTIPCTMEWTVNVWSTKFYLKFFAIFWLDWQKTLGWFKSAKISYVKKCKFFGQILIIWVKLILKKKFWIFFFNV